LTEDSVSSNGENTSKMKCILAIAFAVVLVVAEGKVLPASDVESQQTAAQTPQLSDYIKEAQNKISELGTQISQHLNLPKDQDEFFNTLKEQSNTLASNIQQYVHNMTEEFSRSAGSST
jgi:peptidoglycan hydrolase CwlO-like protein